MLWALLSSHWLTKLSSIPSNVYILDPRVSSENLNLNLKFSSNKLIVFLPVSSLPSYSFLFT